MTAQELILAILHEMNGCGKVKLAKIFLFVEQAYYRAMEESLTDSYYVRLRMGPVPAHFDEILRRGKNTLWKLQMREMDIPDASTVYHEHRYLPLQKPADIPEKAQDIIHEVCAKAKKYTGKQLSMMTHELPAWEYAEPGEPLFIEELVLEKKEHYFQFIDKVNEMESESDDIPESLLGFLSRK
ncbi:MAG: Panacea domain-containing protein [Candidatus Cloacimonetes bacterium]|nr:Panacea domain-containing protein [Candidatus Cloacimonadota bacterium]